MPSKRTAQEVTKNGEGEEDDIDFNWSIDNDMKLQQKQTENLNSKSQLVGISGEDRIGTAANNMSRTGSRQKVAQTMDEEIWVEHLVSEELKDMEDEEL